MPSKQESITVNDQGSDVNVPVYLNQHTQIPNNILNISTLQEASSECGRNSSGTCFNKKDRQDDSCEPNHDCEIYIDLRS